MRADWFRNEDRNGHGQLAAVNLRSKLAVGQEIKIRPPAQEAHIKSNKKNVYIRLLSLSSSTDKIDTKNPLTTCML